MRRFYGTPFVVVAAVLVIAASGCRKNTPNGHGMGQMPPPKVTVVPPHQREIVEYDEFTGRTAPVDYVEVRPRVSGHIEAVKFQSGQLVKKGDVLFQIDPRWHQAEFNRRAAEYESAKVKLANAQRETERSKQLLENRAISTEEADQRRARFEEAQAMLLAAEAARDSAKLDLDYTTIRSPIDGRVSRALITEGNYINASSPDTVLTTVVSVDPIHVYADVDENSLLKFNALARGGKLNNGEGKVPVELQLGDEEGFPHKGYIESFDNKLDPTSGSIVMRAVFPNNDGRIVPGLFARVRLPASEKKPALLIEESAIGTDQAQKFVLTLTASNTVAYRPVKLGPLVDGRRLVREGLQADDQIVQNLVMARVRPGMPVQPQQAVATNGSTSPSAQTAKREAVEAKPAL